MEEPDGFSHQSNASITTSHLNWSQASEDPKEKVLKRHMLKESERSSKKIQIQKSGEMERFAKENKDLKLRLAMLEDMVKCLTSSSQEIKTKKNDERKATSTKSSHKKPVDILKTKQPAMTSCMDDTDAILSAGGSNDSTNYYSVLASTMDCGEDTNKDPGVRLKYYIQMTDPLLYRWMTNLDLNVRESLPIIYLAIPGSNSSISYSISWKSAPAPAKSLIMRCMHLVTGRLSVGRCKRQALNIYEQLRNGIRYFDLQICKKYQSKNPIHGFYFCHRRYCESVIEPITLIRKYLETHQQEFVILDFRKFYNMNSIDHDIVQDFLYNVFGKSIYGPRDGFLVDLTLAKAAYLEKQILIIYRDDNCWENTWPDTCWPTLTVQTENIEDLCGALESKLRRRQPGIGCIARYYYKPKRRSKSISCMALNVFSRIREWLPKQKAGVVTLNTPRLNIITADFIETCDAAFCKEVVNLNDRIVYSSQTTQMNETYV